MNKIQNDGPAVGTVGHFLRNGIIYRTHPDQWQASVSVRGDEFTVTEPMLSASADRYGVLPTWLRLLDDPDGQIEIFGRQIVGAGPRPVDLSDFDPESARAVDDERSRRRTEAWKIDDDQQRAALLKKIRNDLPQRRNVTTYKVDDVA